MKLTVIPPQMPLIELLADRILAGGQNLARAWVVFPEKRQGFYLRRAIASRIKRSFFPPIIDSFDEFVDRLYTEFLGFNDQALQPIDAISLLFELHSDRPAHPGGKAFLSFDEFFPLGLKLYQDLEELKAGKVTREKFLMIDSLVSQSIPEQTRARLQRLSFFYENFYRRLERDNFSTRASRQEKVTERISPDIFDNFEQVILAGFYLLTKAEIELIQKTLASRRAHLYLVDGPRIDRVIKNTGLSLSEIEKISADSRPLPEIKFYLSPDSHGQLFALNQEISEKIESPSLLNERQVIVLPAAETLIPLHQQTLSALPAETYNISLGYPLTRTPLYSFFDCLFNLIQTSDEDGRLYVPDYLNFVLHPYAKNIYFPGLVRRADITRILFHLVETVFTRKKGKLFWAAAEIESDPELQRHLTEYTSQNPEVPEASEFINHLRSIHQKTIIPFLKIESIKDFADKLIALLDYITTSSTASLHLFFQPYADAFFKQFEYLRNSLLSKQSFESRSNYFNLFRKLISEARVAFPGTPLRGLQVLGFWETRCLNFEEVYLLDMNEEVIPGSGRVDSLLPYPLRKALGLSTYEDLEKRIEYYLGLLVAGAKKVCFFFVENSEKEKSRYVEKFLWQKQKDEKRPNPAPYINSISYRMALSSPEIYPIPKSEKVLEILRATEFTPSRLDTYLNCPLQFYYSYILRLSEKEELTETMEKSDIGTLVHSILKDYFKPYLYKAIPEEPDLTWLNSIIEKTFTAVFGQSPGGSFFLMKEQISRHLTDFLTGYQQPLVKELKESGKKIIIKSLETVYLRNYRIKDQDFKLAGKIDRIEKRGGQFYLLDYKTSAREDSFLINFRKLELDERHTWPEAIRSLQLPVYQLLVSPELKVPAEEIRTAALILGKNYIDRAIEFSPFEEEKGRGKKGKISFEAKAAIGKSEYLQGIRREKMEIIKQIIDRLLLEIIDPTVPFSPELAREGSCTYCPYKDFCGK
jgi:hypothetical protein